MRNKSVILRTGQLKINDTYEGESIEQQIAKRMEGGDIDIGGKQQVYTERKDGVLPITNIRSDRFDMAMMAIDAVERTRISKRDAMNDTREKDAKEGKPSESTQGTENN